MIVIRIGSGDSTGNINGGSNGSGSSSGVGGSSNDGTGSSRSSSNLHHSRTSISSCSPFLLLFFI